MAWGLKFGMQKKEALPGEKKIRYSTTAMSSPPVLDYKRYSDVNKVMWIVARILGIAKKRSFKGGKISEISPQLLQKAEDVMVEDAQRELSIEVEKTNRKGRRGGRYESLNHRKDENGYYVIGQSLTNQNPMTPDASLQKLMST